MKAVILAAGYGTRLLPITRCLPKELLPLVDRPVIDVVVEELVEAGVTELLLISSRRKRALEDWFDRDPELEAAVADAPHKRARLAQRPVQVQVVRQQQMAGTGHALRLARTFAAGQPVVVAYPDDLFGRPNCTAQLLETHRRTGASVLAAADGAQLDLSQYGVLDVGEALGRAAWALRRIVEKPPAGEAPSTLVSYGRFVFTPALFDALERSWQEHPGGELYHVGAINELAAAGKVAVRAVDAPRQDTGNTLGYVQAFVEEALSRPELGPQVEAWLRRRLDAE